MCRVSSLGMGPGLRLKSWDLGFYWVAVKKLGLRHYTEETRFFPCVYVYIYICMCVCVWVSVEFKA